MVLKVGQINKISLIKDSKGLIWRFVKFLLTEDVNIPKHSIAKGKFRFIRL